jgi:hypothetical protein
MKMTDEQMIKEIIERRRQWGETRGSDFDWLINTMRNIKKKLNTSTIEK